MGEAGNWPAAVKVVSEWFPQRERAFASGLFNSGAAIGAIVAPPLVAWLVLRLRWQSAFLVSGVTGYVWMAGWWLVYKTPDHLRREVSSPPPTPWRLLRTRFLACLTLSKVFSDPVWYFYIFWFPKYLSTAHGMSLAQIGQIAWIPFVSADLGNLIGGWFTGSLIRRGMPVYRARKVAVAISALLMTFAFPAGYMTSVTLSIVLISVATFGYTSYNANCLAFPAEVFPRNMLGSTWGLASLGSGFGGMLFSWLSGRVIDAYGYGPAFVAYGIMPLIAVSIVLFAMGPLRPDPAFQPVSDLTTQIPT
jgi:ACS family hexuronate transporter-like MFS transporter